MSSQPQDDDGPSTMSLVAGLRPEHTDWRTTLDALPGLAFALGADGNVEFVNRFFCAYTGLPAAAFEVNAWREIVHPDDLATAQRELADGLASGTTFRSTSRLRDATGAYRRYAATTRPVRDEAGAIVRWLGIASDIDDFDRAIAEAATSRERLTTFLKTVPLIVWTADASGWIDWYNSQWYAFTGQTPAEAAGWGWQDAHHPQDFAEVMLRWPHSIATGEPFEMEFRLRRHDGEFRWMLTRIVPLRDETGRIVRWYGSNTDIHDQKVLQERTTRVARLLQDELLPTSLPVGTTFRLDAVYDPAESDARVGGDWYDALALPDGRILVSIGDVTGHGVEAAAYAARLRQSIAFAAIEDPDPARVLARINRLICTQRLEVATAGVAVFDPRDLGVTYALAGHPPPVIGLANGAAYLGEVGGGPLGVDLAMRTKNATCALARHGVFAFYTDGITEHARDVAAAEAALCEGVLSIVAFTHRARPAMVLRDAVLRGAATTDDAAIVVIQASPPSRRREEDDRDLVRQWRFHSSHARSAQTTRHILAEYLRSIARDPDGAYEAELVIGEILANTVEHAPGLVEIEIDWRRARPSFVARDNGRGWAPDSLAWPSDRLSENGRGTPIVIALADDVVFRLRENGGTEIRCVLPIEREMTP